MQKAFKMFVLLILFIPWCQHEEVLENLFLCMPIIFIYSSHLFSDPLMFGIYFDFYSFMLGESNVNCERKHSDYIHGVENMIRKPDWVMLGRYKLSSDWLGEPIPDNTRFNEQKHYHPSCPYSLPHSYEPFISINVIKSL